MGAQGFRWTEGGQTVTQPLRYPLTRLEPYENTPVFSSRSLDNTVHARRLAGATKYGARAEVRYDRDQAGLLDMLRARKGRPITYFQDMGGAPMEFEATLVDVRRETRLGREGVRSGLGEYRLRVDLLWETDHWPVLTTGRLLDFRAERIPPGATFSRSSSATQHARDHLVTRVEEVGEDVPRNRHRVEANDGKTYEVYLHEDQTTNLLTRSEEFEHPDWHQSSVSVDPDHARAPDGEETADQLEAADSNPHVRQEVSVDPDGIYTLSAFWRAGTNEWVYIRIQPTNGGNDSRVWFDIAHGAVGQTSGAANILRHDIEPLGGGWYRTWMTMDVGSVGTDPVICRLQLTGADGGASPPEGATSWLWGAMMEPGHLSSYIPTTDAPTSRAHDDLRLPFDPRIREMVVMCEWVELGALRNPGTSTRLMSIGEVDSRPAPGLRLWASTADGDGELRGDVVNAAGDYDEVVASSGTVQLWDHARAWLAVQINPDAMEMRAGLQTRVNGGAWQDHGWGSWIPVDADEWSDGSLYVADRGDGQRVGRSGHRRILALPGSPDHLTPSKVEGHL